MAQIGITALLFLVALVGVVTVAWGTNTYDLNPGAVASLRGLPAGPVVVAGVLESTSTATPYPVQLVETRSESNGRAGPFPTHSITWTAIERVAESITLRDPATGATVWVDLAAAQLRPSASRDGGNRRWRGFPAGAQVVVLAHWDGEQLRATVLDDGVPPRAEQTTYQGRLGLHSTALTLDLIAALSAAALALAVLTGIIWSTRWIVRALFG